MVQEPQDIGSIRQLIGETYGTVKILAEQNNQLRMMMTDAQREAKIEADRQEDRFTAKIRDLGEERRQSEQIYSNKFDQLGRQSADTFNMLGKQIKEIDDKVTGVSGKVTGVEAAVKSAVEELTKLKDPVTKLVDLRDKIVRYGLAAGGILTLVWILIGPFIQSVLTAFAKNFLGIK